MPPPPARSQARPRGRPGPSRSSITRVASRCIASRSWKTASTATPASDSEAISSSARSRLAGSSAETGSSSSSSRGGRTVAAARLTRWRSPPDSTPQSTSHSASSSASRRSAPAAASAASARSSPRRRAAAATSSSGPGARRRRQELGDVTQLAAAQPGQCPVGQRGQLDGPVVQVQRDGARVGQVAAVHAAQQARLACAARPGERDVLARRDVEVDALQRRDRAPVDGVQRERLHQAPHFEYWAFGCRFHDHLRAAATSRWV